MEVNNGRRNNKIKKNETQSLSRDEFISKLIKNGAGTLAATIVGNGMLGTASKIFAKDKNETPVKRKYHCYYFGRLLFFIS